MTHKSRHLSMLFVLCLLLSVLMLTASCGGDSAANKPGAIASGATTPAATTPAATTPGTTTPAATTPAAHVHEIGQWIPEVPPTCLTEGVAGHYLCAGCGENLDRDGVSLASLTLPIGGHAYGTWVEASAATCEDAGVKGHFFCPVCETYFDAEKKELDSILVAAAGHTLGAMTEAVPPSCETTGALAHSTCSVCGKHFDAAGGELATVSVDATGHTYGTLVAEVPATCTAPGVKAHYTCAVCLKNFDGSKTPLTDTAIAALGHEYAAASNDENHWEECGRCHDVKNSAPHNWDGGTITKEATADAAGECLHTCLDCGKTKTVPIAYDPTPKMAVRYDTLGLTLLASNGSYTNGYCHLSTDGIAVTLPDAAKLSGLTEGAVFTGWFREGAFYEPGETMTVPAAEQEDGGSIVFTACVSSTLGKVTGTDCALDCTGLASVSGKSADGKTSIIFGAKDTTVPGNVTTVVDPETKAATFTKHGSGADMYITWQPSASGTTLYRTYELKISAVDEKEFLQGWFRFTGMWCIGARIVKGGTTGTGSVYNGAGENIVPNTFGSDPVTISVVVRYAEDLQSCVAWLYVNGQLYEGATPFETGSASKTTTAKSAGMGRLYVPNGGVGSFALYSITSFDGIAISENDQTNPEA